MVNLARVLGVFVIAMLTLAMTMATPIYADSSLSQANAASLGTCVKPDQQTLSAIVPVATDNGSHATGVVYDDNHVLTAAHAVAGSGKVFVRVADQYVTADLIRVDHARDLALLSVDTQSIKPLLIAGVGPTRAQMVWAVGYPRAQSIMTSQGFFQDYREGALQTSASIESGQSGGGLLSCQNGGWVMLGMLRGYGAYLKDNTYIKMENLSVSVAATTINKFLHSYQ